MTVYQVISTQPNRSDRHKSVISPATIKVDDPATSVGIDITQTVAAGNFPDHRYNLALVTAYLLAATDRDYSPLSSDRRNVSDQVRAEHAELWRLWRIRVTAAALLEELLK